MNVCYVIIEMLIENISFIFYFSDMLPLPNTTKENYKVLFYRLVEYGTENVSILCSEI